MQQGVQRGVHPFWDLGGYRGGMAFYVGIKGGGVSLFSVKGWGVPIFQPGRKKKL
jgi:hypothetical protein